MLEYKIFFKGLLKYFGNMKGKCYKNSLCCFNTRQSKHLCAYTQTHKFNKVRAKDISCRLRKCKIHSMFTNIIFSKTCAIQHIILESDFKFSFILFLSIFSFYFVLTLSFSLFLILFYFIF